MPEEVMVVTTESVPGYEVEKVLGLVWGSSIKARHLGKDIKMALKHVVGGELTDYAEMMETLGARPWSAWLSTRASLEPTP